MGELRTTLMLFVPMAIVALTGVGCTRAQAKVTPVEPPALNVPAPPPRVVEPVVAEVAPSVEPVEPFGEPVPVETNPRTSQRTGPARAEPPKVETPAADAARPPEGPMRPQSSVLQTIPAGKEGEVEREIRAQLTRATGNLHKVNLRTLTADGRANYDQTWRFISQAEEALQAKNLVFAATVADKADTLAAQLVGR
jgi:hypothetical protein